MVPINKRYEKRETKREAKALIAAKLETAIEKELLARLQAGTYKEIYNLEEKQFNDALDQEEEVEETSASAEEEEVEATQDLYARWLESEEFRNSLQPGYTGPFFGEWAATQVQRGETWLSQNY